MTAAVYAARKKLNVLMVSKDIGGQVLLTARIENYMGYQYVEGYELIQKFEEQVKQFPIKLVEDRIVAVSRLNGGFEVKSQSGKSFQGKAVIIASGKRSRQLNAPGEEKLIGRGVSYCAVCDGPVFAGEKVAVVGGGNSALGAIADMVKIAEHVYAVSLTPLTGDPVLIDRVKNAPNLTIYLEHQVQEIQGADRVTGIVIKDLKTGEMNNLEVRGVFVEIGLIPNSDMVKGLLKLNDLGEIQINCICETEIAGLYAAGDVTNVPEKQIIIAAGEGAKAALQAHHYLQRL